ncbi:MAG TPA: hypothetical protein VII81_12390 [Terriglobales bacterium]
MHCPYCHTEYTTERPCFCQPLADPKKTAREEYYTRSSAEETICVNSHRGARLD